MATAEAAAAKGASLVLIARSAITLQRLARKIDDTGRRALSVVCDVSDRNAVELAARQAMEHFGRIDTWVNDAGVGIYGRLDEVLEADSRRMFDVNFWGVVHGSLAALRYLKLQGGTLINVGSEVSEGSVALLGMYTAAKQAVRGFTDALRIETQEVDKSNVSITLIEPQSVDTPFPQHARNYMDREPRLSSPTVSAERVAKAILRAAVRPT
ncbi:MAG TPA: SDR family NAD(P)-dependent oxidoreductase, partial [Planctomycetota bacterium]|nr:SDR family NAD(P)-dependent oxidoreductase [Planctomycetota bacterium]